MTFLAVDIGNTNTKTAVTEGDDIYEIISFPTSRLISDSAQKDFSELEKIIEKYNPSGLIIASVVAGAAEKYTAFCKTKENLKNPVFVSGELKFRYSFPEAVKKEIGADILATNAACDALWGDCILVDAGTAITFQILENHVFRGGIICAGLGMTAKALHYETSLLPEVELEIPDELIGFNTVSCIQSGIMYGNACMIEGMIERIENHYQKKFTVIATGGSVVKLNSLMKKPFDKIENNLVFKGLNIIYNDNRF